MIRAVLLAVALLAAGRSTDPLAGRTAGPPQQCVDLTFSQAPEIVDDRTILYRQTNWRIWRTGPDDTCPGLEPLATLVVDQYNYRLCRGDRFRVLRPGQVVPSAYCRFTSFTPYVKK